MWKKALQKADYIIRDNSLLSPLLRNWIFRKRWRTELSLLEGESLSASSHPSIIHMGINRSATQWIKSVLSRVGRTAGLVHVRWNEMAFDSEYPFLDHLDNLGRYRQIFRPTGYLYSAFGGYPRGIPEFGKYKVVLVVRDPRDILVSRYFSAAVSHREPLPGSSKREKFLQTRQFAKEVSLDEYVIEQSQELKRTYDCYVNQLLSDHPDVHVCRYEDMTADVELWLHNLISYIEISPPSNIISEIIKEAQEVQSRDEEDITAHVRKGEPGDYLEKLSKRTVEKLNVKFENVLRKFGYS